MRTLVTALPALALALAVAAPVAAQERATLAPDVRYEFHDHDVGGDRYTPDHADILIRQPGARHSLIRPRVHFVPELMKSVESL